MPIAPPPLEKSYGFSDEGIMTLKDNKLSSQQCWRKLGANQFTLGLTALINSQLKKSVVKSIHL